MKRPGAPFRILSPTAILGYGFPEDSFRRGLRRRPHLIGVDAGSTDPGPYYLGSGTSFTDREGVKRDLRLMLRAGVRAGIPVVIGSAGGAGAAPHLAWCRAIVREIAREERLAFRLGVVATDVPRATVLAALRGGRVRALPCVPALTEEAVRASTHIVAQVGLEPVQAALRRGCDVVLCGRCYDPAVFAALPVLRGHDPALALHLGKILECAAIAATPGSGADCVLGTLRGDAFELETLNPARRFTRLSTAAHTLYEKSDPTRLPGPGGLLNLEACVFRELRGGRVEVRGSRFEPDPEGWLKIEGARPAGFRCVSIAGIRDPILVRRIDATLEAVRAAVEPGRPGRLWFHVYGRDGVMRDAEPERGPPGREVGLVIEAVAPTQAQADSLCSLARSTLLHYGYPGRISTAGNLAFPFSPSDLRAGPVYAFSIYHLVRPGARPFAFPVRVETLRGDR